MTFKFIHGAKLYFGEGTTLRVLFMDGLTKQYDMEDAIKDIPELEPLRNRELFLKGHLEMGGIVWNDDLDISIEEIYENGKIVKNDDDKKELLVLGAQIYVLRNSKLMTQQQLSKLSGIDQSDISKLERGELNPSIMQIKRIAKALKADLKIMLK